MNVATLTNSLKALFGTAASSTAIASTDLVPFMNSSGTPSGLSSISQLASVLGGALKITSGTLTLSKNNPVTLSTRNKMLILGSNINYFNGVLPMIFSYGNNFSYLSTACLPDFEAKMTIVYSDSELTLTGKLDNDFNIPYVLIF